jgi:hypothetical protein
VLLLLLSVMNSSRRADVCGTGAVQQIEQIDGAVITVLVRTLLYSHTAAQSYESYRTQQTAVVDLPCVC